MPKKSKINVIKGIHDSLPENDRKWNMIKNNIEDLVMGCGYERIETSVLETSELYNRFMPSIDGLVKIQRHTKKDPEIILRSELFAPTTRSFIQNGLKTLPKPIKLYNLGSVFSYSEDTGHSQKTHFNIQQIGIKSASAEAELISACWQFFNNLEIDNIQLHINTLGNSKSKKDLHTVFAKYFYNNRLVLCSSCRSIINKNPLKIFSCSNKNCQSTIENAPQIIDAIDQRSKKHFYELLEYLDELSVPYIFNPKILPDYDFFSGPVFKFVTEDNSMSIAYGGRFDDLHQILGSEVTPSTGISLDLNNIALLIKDKTVRSCQNTNSQPDIYLIQLGSSAKKKCFHLLHELRSKKFHVSSSLSNKSISVQLKKATKQQARMAVIIGQKEAIDNTVIIRDMRTGMQDTIDWDHAIHEITLRLG